MSENTVRDTSDSKQTAQRSVLVVDDDELFRTTIVAALRRRGFAVREANDVKTARSALRDFQPDSILLDIRMPGQLGIELIEPAKILYPEVRVVVLTGYGSIATAVRAMKQGASEYLTKPAPLQSLIAAIEGQESDEDIEIPKSDESLSTIEQEHIQKVLLSTGGNISKAAKVLGIHRRSLQRKLGTIGEE